MAPLPVPAQHMRYKIQGNVEKHWVTDFIPLVKKHLRDDAEYIALHDPEFRFHDDTASRLRGKVKEMETYFASQVSKRLLPGEDEQVPSTTGAAGGTPPTPKIRKPPSEVDQLWLDAFRFKASANHEGAGESTSFVCEEGARLANVTAGGGGPPPSSPTTSDGGRKRARSGVRRHGAVTSGGEGKGKEKGKGKGKAKSSQRPPRGAGHRKDDRTNFFRLPPNGHVTAP